MDRGTEDIASVFAMKLYSISIVRISRITFPTATSLCNIVEQSQAKDMKLFSGFSLSFYLLLVLLRTSLITLIFSRGLGKWLVRTNDSGNADFIRFKLIGFGQRKTT